MHKHCILGGVGIAVAVLFSTIALMVSLCGGGHERGFHHRGGHDGPPMMHQWLDGGNNGPPMMAPDAPVVGPEQRQGFLGQKGESRGDTPVAPQGGLENQK